jgi:hypothetical protein
VSDYEPSQQMKDYASRHKIEINVHKDKEVNAQNFDTSIKDANFIVIRSHGGRSKSDNNFYCFEDDKSNIFLLLSDITNCLQGSRANKCKMIVADACFAGKVNDPSFVKALEAKGVLYLGDTRAHQPTEDPLTFTILCAGNPQKLDYYIKWLNNGPPIRKYVRFPTQK